jgi:hypothetical protein
MNTVWCSESSTNWNRSQVRTSNMVLASSLPHAPRSPPLFSLRRMISHESMTISFH